MIGIAHLEPNTELLGPFSRFVLWVHGCCFQCPGCMAEFAREGAFTEFSPAELAEHILASGAEGITISGGEPFLQAGELRQMIDLVRERRDMGVIVYSGFRREDLEADEEKRMLLDASDILIDGPYIQELDDGAPYVGSANQQIIYLTDRYAESGAAYYRAGRRRVEITVGPNGAQIIGVPGKDALRLWKSLKNQYKGN